MGNWRIGLLLAGMLGGWCSADVQAQTLGPQHVKAVAAHLSRPMTTAEQAAHNPRYVAIRMTTCSVTVPDGDPESIYLYQEQALAEQTERPYRQRFLEIRLSQNGRRVESRTFKPANPAPWTGLCQQSEPSTAGRPLGPEVCVVSLRPSALGYVGSTPAAGCPVNLRGAVRLTNTVVLHQDGMDTWDRGFSAEGFQVWGAYAEPYQYRWLD